MSENTNQYLKFNCYYCHSDIYCEFSEIGCRSKCLVCGEIQKVPTGAQKIPLLPKGITTIKCKNDVCETQTNEPKWLLFLKRLFRI